MMMTLTITRELSRSGIVLRQAYAASSGLDPAIKDTIARTNAVDHRPLTLVATSIHHESGRAGGVVANKYPGRDPDHLRYALRCAARIEQLQRVKKDTFLASADRVDALCWHMYQLVDVVGKISDAVKARHPEVPWRAIASLRNFYAHSYVSRGADPERDLDVGEEVLPRHGLVTAVTK